jgi:annexin A7/11
MFSHSRATANPLTVRRLPFGWHRFDSFADYLALVAVLSDQTSNSYQPPQQQPPYGGYNNGPPPPQQNTYGNAAYASPHQQYNAPPPPPNQYQNPHISGAGPTIFLGTEVSVLDGMNMGMPPPPPQRYDPTFDVTRIRAATKGFGTDESALIATLAPLSALQTAALARTFEAQVGRSLMDVMEKETRGWFLETLRGLVLGPIGYDCWLIQRACKGTGELCFLSSSVLPSHLAVLCVCLTGG